MISDVFYQVAHKSEEMRHYGAIYAHIPLPERVLVVGSGTGNDVAAALKAGVQHVDAVDIDPAIVAMGRRHHPDRPYDDPRVNVIVDDARHAFRVLPSQTYDAVVFGLLDSHTGLGMSSVRLDNYVFTRESLAEARRLVKPGGHLVITAATFRPWFGERFVNLLSATVNRPVEVFQTGKWFTYIGRVSNGASNGVALPPAAGVLPTDDWPFLYLPHKEIPQAYLCVVGCLATASVVVLRLNGIEFGDLTGRHGHFFFLGAAFLLMEVHAVNRLALLFGTTWLVSAVTIAIILLLIVCANASVIVCGGLSYPWAYAALAVSLATSFWIQPSAVLGGGAAQMLGFSFALLSPVYFAGLIFARSFRVTQQAAPAIGANIMGSVLGGWIEYSTMMFGMRALVLLAAVFYALSLILLRRTGTDPAGSEMLNGRIRHKPEASARG
jgi:SAM-dependent methyltransferase